VPPAVSSTRAGLQSPLACEPRQTYPELAASPAVARAEAVSALPCRGPRNFNAAAFFATDRESLITTLEEIDALPALTAVLTDSIPVAEKVDLLAPEPN